jgi:hypothetical protein
MKEVVKVVSSLIEEVKIINHNIANVEFLIDSYFEWKDEKGDLKEYVKDRIEKLNKDRNRDSVHNK